MTKQLSEEIQEFKELCKHTTKVVAWYPHHCEVRGPYGRWLIVSEVAESYKDIVADQYTDSRFAAAAMNLAPKLVSIIEELEARLAFENMIKGDIE